MAWGVSCQHDHIVAELHPMVRGHQEVVPGLGVQVLQGAPQLSWWGRGVSAVPAARGVRPGDAALAPSGQTAALGTRRSRQTALATGSRQGCGLSAPHWRTATTTFVVRGSAVRCNAVHRSVSITLPCGAAETWPPVPRTATHPHKTATVSQLAWLVLLGRTTTGVHGLLAAHTRHSTPTRC